MQQVWSSASNKVSYCSSQMHSTKGNNQSPQSWQLLRLWRRLVAWALLACPW
jgi:hypothetical protein